MRYLDLGNKLFAPTVIVGGENVKEITENRHGVERFRRKPVLKEAAKIIGKSTNLTRKERWLLEYMVVIHCQRFLRHFFIKVWIHACVRSACLRIGREAEW